MIDKKKLAELREFSIQHGGLGNHWIAEILDTLAALCERWTQENNGLVKENADLRKRLDEHKDALDRETGKGAKARFTMARLIAENAELKKDVLEKQDELVEFGETMSKLEAVAQAAEAVCEHTTASTAAEHSLKDALVALKEKP